MLHSDLIQTIEYLLSQDFYYSRDKFFSTAHIDLDKYEPIVIKTSDGRIYDRIIKDSFNLETMKEGIAFYTYTCRTGAGGVGAAETEWAFDVHIIGSDHIVEVETYRDIYPFPVVPPIIYP